MSKELKNCPFCNGDGYYTEDDVSKPCNPSTNRPAASVPSEIEIMAAINKAGFDLGSVKGLEISRQIRALLAEGKGKEAQG